MSAPLPVLPARAMHALGGFALALIWVLFAVSHVVGFQGIGRAALLFFAACETLIAGTFVLRGQATRVSARPKEWVVAVAGTFLPLLLRPVSELPPPAADLGMIAGSCLTILGVCSLNTSFAIVPAVREIKTRGMYRFVRHPIYAGYLLTWAFYLVANFSLTNTAIIVASVALLLLRVQYEEVTLAMEPEYAAYRARVRWRLVPLVF